MANQLTVFIDFTPTTGAVAVRGLEILKNTQLNGGCNVPASNSPGIGIANAGDVSTINLDQSLPNWTLLDQDGDPRTPQVGQYIGGSGLGAGVAGKGTVGITVSNSLGNKGFIGPSPTPFATLADLAVGWTAVAP